MAGVEADEADGLSRVLAAVTGVASIAGSRVATVARQLLGGEAAWASWFPRLAELGPREAIYPALAASLGPRAGVGRAGTRPDAERRRACFSGGSPSA